jgi:hypothetical protein
MKILEEGAELFRANGRTDVQTDRQTDLTKTTFAFRSFAKGSNKTGTCMTLPGFEHAILTIKLFQTYVLDLTFNGIVTSLNPYPANVENMVSTQQCQQMAGGI